MIPRAIILFLILFTGYNVFCTRVVSSEALSEPAEATLIANIIRAEQFLRAEPKPETVLLGTSMSVRLTRMEDVTNLSMGGCGPVTALTVVHAAEEPPRLLLVEANNFPGGLNEELIHNVFGAIPWRWKEAVPAMEFSYRPSTVLVNWLRQRSGGRGMTFAGGKVAPELFRRLVKAEVDLRREPADPQRDLPRLQEARRMIDDLERRGTRVVFFEMPVHPDIAATPGYVSRMEILRHTFPNGRYRWIHPPAGEEFVTSDGVHLVMRSANAYRDFLLASIRETNPIGTSLRQ